MNTAMIRYRRTIALAAPADGLCMAFGSTDWSGPATTVNAPSHKGRPGDGEVPW